MAIPTCKNYLLSSSIISSSKKLNLNKEIETYLYSFNQYYDQDILHYNHFKIIATTNDLSVIEIKTELIHNITNEVREYKSAGEAITELRVY